MKDWITAFDVAPQLFYILGGIVALGTYSACCYASAAIRQYVGRWRHVRRAWPRSIVGLLVLGLTGCATFGQKPQPVGEPGPVACIGAQSAILSWEELDKYMRAVLEAQQAYSCGPLAPSLGPAAPAVPALR